MADPFVTLHHPVTGGVGVVAESTVEHYRTLGWRTPEEIEAAGAPPPRSAKVGDWRAYAVKRGLTADAAAELTKDELVDQFSEPPGDEPANNQGDTPGEA